MVRIGMLIGDRYEVLEKIGTGGMSDVYKAKDHKLNRFVAVKVLKQEFSENANFVSKFRVEAQAAAGLMHPNIVNVYDVGQEEGIYYIVMELVEGITLKKYIEKKARLSYKEAISIAIQVSMGIESAHNNHIIHRDIKPQNIIISKEGKVKVTDFGIAKAATSNTITSNVMGSVHYTSPEQARGGYSDEKSDIYSLGITLFEMLTGRVPFNGETTVAIAIKHIQEPMPSPREFVSEIPYSVEQIVYKCTQKSPDRRYQSMQDLIADLKHALMNPDEDFVVLDNNDMAGATKTMEDLDIGRVKKQAAKSREFSAPVSTAQRGQGPSKNTSKSKSTKSASSKNSYQKSTAPASSRKPRTQEYYEDDYYDDYEPEAENDPKIEKVTTILAIVAAVLIGLIIIFLVAKFLGLLDFSKDTEEPDTTVVSAEQVEMIDVVGKNADAVKKALIDVGLTPVIEEEYSTDYEEGKVISCDKQPGTVVPVGTEVTLTVSKGQIEDGIEIPDVVGLTVTEAKVKLADKGFVPVTMEGSDEFIAKDCIFKQSPNANSKAPAGDQVIIYVSLGPEEQKVMVPNLLGQDEMTAMALLTEKGLTMGTVTEVNNEDIEYKGLVCAQSLNPDEWVAQGTAVDISISLGPEAATYSFNEPINGPTAEEDPNFRAGTLVTVTLTAEDGTVLLSTQTDSFPIIQQNITGITSPVGVVTFQYINAGEATSVINDDGTVTTIEGTPEGKEIKRGVFFTTE